MRPVADVEQCSVAECVCVELTDARPRRIMPAASGCVGLRVDEDEAAGGAVLGVGIEEEWDG